MSIPTGVFTQNALAAIAGALAEANNPEEFLKMVDRIAADPTNTLTYPFSIDEPEPLQFRAHSRAADGESFDSANAERVYEHLGAIERVQASDPRLWTHLAFVEYRDYMERRWPLEGENWKNRVKDRWFLQRSTRGVLIRHGIARLWWIAELTYDPHLEHPLAQADDDPWAYTRFAFGSEDRILQIFDRQTGHLENINFAILGHMASHEDRQQDTFIRSLTKEILREYGIRDLGLLNAQQSQELVERLGNKVAARL